MICGLCFNSLLPKNHIMFEFLVALIVTFLSALIFVAGIRKLAIRFNLTAQKNFRRTQENTIPLLGGLAVFFAFFLGIHFLGPSHSILYHLSYLAPVILFYLVCSMI